MPKGHKPRRLREALSYFADPDRCLDAVVGLRWRDGVRCPGCGGQDVVFLSTRRVWKCKREHPGRQFSVKVGTIFEDSPIVLDKWLGAIWMVANRPEDTTAHSLTRVLGVTAKTAWYMLQRIQLAMNTDAFARLAYPRRITRQASVISLPRRRSYQREAVQL